MWNIHYGIGQKDTYFPHLLQAQVQISATSLLALQQLLSASHDAISFGNPARSGALELKRRQSRKLLPGIFFHWHKYRRSPGRSQITMFGLFGSKKPERSPEFVVDGLRESVKTTREVVRLARTTGDTRAEAKAREDLSKHVSALKVMLVGDLSASETAVPPAEMDVSRLIRLACTGDLLSLLAENLPLMVFETRKDAVQIFNNLLRRGMEDSTRVTAPDDGAIGKDEPVTAVGQISKGGGHLVMILVAGYDDNEIALNSGAMLRECLRDESLSTLLLESPVFWRFFQLVEKNDFDVASDAFASFKDLLTRHQQAAASFMVANLDRFVLEYNGLLRSSNYVTRRQSLKLLGEMLLERANFRIMTQYIASPGNLRLIMNLLLDSRRNIQFEAFHVFKVFVANPKKPPEIQQILVRNKDRMVAYLADFLSDRDDEQFQMDRREILEEIQRMTVPQ
jgi:calcium binding protein 39